MKNFNRDRRPGGSRDDNRGPRPGMNQAICSDCGQKCEVPFRPTGDRPVYCTACFSKHGNSNPAKSQGRSFQKSGFGDKPMFEAVCDKCGDKCELPFRPSSGKPVYCRQCFDKGGSSSGNFSGNASAKAPDQFKQQFEILNSKLDKILKVLNPEAAGQAPKTAKPEIEVKKIKAKKTPAKPAAKKAKAKKK